jgi:hypothetical protein
MCVRDQADTALSHFEKRPNDELFEHLEIQADPAAEHEVGTPQLQRLRAVSKHTQPLWNAPKAVTRGQQQHGHKCHHFKYKHAPNLGRGLQPLVHYGLELWLLDLLCQAHL